jgi:hypothetical protein
MKNKLDAKQATERIHTFLKLVEADLNSRKVGMCSGKVENGGPVEIQVGGQPVVMVENVNS